MESGKLRHQKKVHRGPITKAAAKRMIFCANHKRMSAAALQRTVEIHDDCAEKYIRAALILVNGLGKHKTVTTDTLRYIAKMHGGGLTNGVLGVDK